MIIVLQEFKLFDPNIDVFNNIQKPPLTKTQILPN